MSRRFPSPRLPAPGQTVALDKDTSHHILRVTQLPRGKELTLFDGQGWECEARLTGVSGESALVEGLSEPRPTLARRPLVLLMGLPKKPAWELILRMGTELGVTLFLPFPAARSVATGLHPDRWEKIVIAAAGQCGRGDLPAISAAPSLAAALERAPGGVERRVMVPGSAPLSPASGGVAVLIGPEGGLSPEEIQLAGEADFAIAGLGSWTLRADTAAVVALAASATP